MPLFECCFPYVCPDPVFGKMMMHFWYIHGIAKEMYVRFSHLKEAVWVVQRALDRVDDVLLPV